MFAEALTMGVQKKPEAQQEYLQTIISENRSLDRTIFYFLLRALQVIETISNKENSKR
jgi:hypothetical protein